MDDVIWYAPGLDGDSIWYGGYAQRASPAGRPRRSWARSVRSSVTTTEIPTTTCSGTARARRATSLWKGGPGGFTSSNYSVAGSYLPFGGDFDGNGVDDILWYTSASGGDRLWSFRPGGAYTSTAAVARSGVKPIIGDFDADQYDDVLWYGAGSVADTISWGSPTGLVTR